MNECNVKEMWFEDNDLHVINKKKEHIVFKDCKLINSKQIEIEDEDSFEELPLKIKVEKESNDKDIS